MNMKRNELLTLKAKIKGLAAEGSRTRKFIHESKGNWRYAYWNVKRYIGAEARYHLIAYGLLRGLSYEDIEPTSSKEGLSSWLFDYNYLATICQRHCYSQKGHWTPKRLQDLIVGNRVNKEAA